MDVRAELAQHYVERLLSSDAPEAVVRDGWSPKMVAAGFDLHARTWTEVMQ